MLNEILNIYDCGLRDGKKGLTQTEAIHRIVEKINLIIQHFNVLENNCNKSIEDFSEKVEYYLNNGMVDEVNKKLDQFTQDGTFDLIINEKLFNEINGKIEEVKNDLVNFKQLYNENKNATDNVIQNLSSEINNNSSRITENSNNITKVGERVTNVENEIKSIKNDYSTVEIVTTNDGGMVKKFIMEDNKMAKIRKKYIQCEVTAKQWQGVWENLGANTNNNNGSIWIPFYWEINPSKVIDATMTLRDLNKWVWLSLGHCKIGNYGLGYINNNGCYVYVENKAPTEQTIGLAFTICITELYD
ncbi:MAG: hypothetical protein MSA15_13320 [Clostridium sp.]|nr:hypothetical protein [Clostridium sp.]